MADAMRKNMSLVLAAALAAGAKKVYCFDHTCNREKDCYARSGIAAAVAANGGEMRSGADRKSYRQAAIPGAQVLKGALVHTLFLDCDVVINARRSLIRASRSRLLKASA